MKLPATKLNTFAEIRELGHPKNIVFGCALMQRMLPNYILFSRTSQFGDAKQAEAILNLIWDWCMSPKNKFNPSAQLEKLEEIIPDIENFDTFGVYPALDFCMALSCMLQSFSDEHEHPAVTISKLSQGSVEAYILAASETELDNQEIKQDPLMEYEIQTQQSLLSYCQDSKMSKEWVKELRSDILADNMSNLGITVEA